MSEHSQVEQQLTIYRELGAAERQSVDRHVQRCAVCARTQAVYQAMDGALARLPTPTPDAGLRAGFYAALAQERPAVPSFWSLAAGRLPSLAAQFVLLAVLLLLGWTVWQGVEEWMAQPTETAVTPTNVATVVPETPALTDEIYITLQNVRYSSEATVIDLTVHTDARWVPDVPTASPPLGLMARDMQLTDSEGREYPGLGVLGGLATVDPATGAGLFDLSLQFGPIAPDAGQLALAFNLEFTNLPAAEVLTISLDGRQPGDSWTEPQAITFAGLPLDIDYTLTPHAGGPAAALLLALNVESPPWPDIRLLCLTLYGSSQALDLTNQCAAGDGSISHHYALNEGMPAEPVRLFMSGSLYLEPAWQLTWAVPETAVSTETAVSATPTPSATAPTAALSQTQTIDGVTVTLLDVVYGESEMVIEAALGRNERVATVRLFDDKNRPYSTTQTPRAEYQPETGQMLLALRFPPVAANAQQLTLQLTLEVSREADRSLLLDLNGRQWGDVWLLDETIQIGDWPVRLRQARLAPPNQEAVGPPSAFARLEITAEPILASGVSLGCLFIHVGDGTGPGSGCTSSSEQIVAYMDLTDGLPTQPQLLTINGSLYLDGPWQFTWLLPGATAVSPTPTPDTAALLPQPLTPIFTAPAIHLWPAAWRTDAFQWAKNGAWFGFGVVAEEPENGRSLNGLLGHIHFLNLHSQEVCPFPHDQDVRAPMLGWGANDTAVVYNAEQLGAGWWGVPCTDAWQPAADITDIYLPPQLSSPISPDQTYRAEALVTEEGQGNIWINLSLIEQASGLAANNFTYLHKGSLPNLVINVWHLRENPDAGYWLDNETFLIPTTLDQGPLLLTTGGDVVNLARDLFDVPERIGQQGEFLLAAEAVYQPDSDTFDFLLSASGAINAAPPALLYHGDSSIVEQLPADAMQFVFSANGRWLAVYPQAAITNSRGYYDRWLRPVKPAGTEEYYLLPDEAHRYRHLDANWERLAVVDSTTGRVTMQTFPDETPLAIWTTAEYTLHDAAAWSPDGRFLLLSGTHKESGEDGLFLIETGS